MKHTEKTKKLLSKLAKKQWKDGKVSTKGLFKKSQTPWNKGKKIYRLISQEEHLKRSLSLKGKKKSQEHIEKVRKALIGKKRKMPAWNKGKKFPQFSRENSPLWKGGIKVDNDRRKSYEAVQWRSDVFQRDNWTCQTCGARGNLQAHHIKSWAKYPEFRYELDNGVTLCIPCHKLTDNYGRKKEKACQKPGGLKVLNQS